MCCHADMACLPSPSAEYSLSCPPRPYAEGHYRFHVNFVLSLWDVNIAPLQYGLQ